MKNRARRMWFVSALSVALGVAVLMGRANAYATKEIILTPPADVKFVPLDPDDSERRGPQISVVFGDMKKRAPLGFFFKVPAGFKPGPHTHTSDYHAIVLEGAVHDFAAGGLEGPPIGPGGHWFQPGNLPHDNHCASTTPCVMFIYTPHGFDFIPVKEHT